jgi:predicted dehydrogenase
MKTIRLGYIGAGFMAQKVHLPNFAKVAGCELVALAERRADLREKVADYHRIPKRYPDHLAMLDQEQLDAVALSAAFGVQSQLAIDCLRRGLPVFMEKPMATSTEQAEAVVEACREGKGRLMVGYMKRYDFGNILGRDQIRQFQSTGELGRITYIRCHGFLSEFQKGGFGWTAGLDTHCESSQESVPESRCATPAWMAQEMAQKYANYLQQYTHNINLARWLVGHAGPLNIRAVDLDANGATGVVIFDVGGVRAVLETGHLTHHGWEESTQVYFEHGWVKLSSPPLLLRNVPAEVEVYRTRPNTETIYPIPTPAWAWAYQEEARQFIERVRSGEPFESGAEDTCHDVKAFEDIFHQFQEKQSTAGGV